MSRERYVIVGIVLLALIVAMPIAHGLAWLWVYAGWNNPFFFVREATVTAMMAYAMAGGAAAYCLFHAPTRQLANEVAEELSKVSWPTREETGNATVVVVATVLVCAAYFGVFDAIWLALTDFILGAPKS